MRRSKNHLLRRKRLYNASMNDTFSEPSANGMAQTIAELERRVLALEAKVAAIPDSKQIEERITTNVKASLPPPPPPIDPTRPPSLKDIEIPIPSVQTVVATAKTTWMVFEMLAELQMLFWTLFDRRYHMAWITRFTTIALLALIITSQWWVPLAKVDYIGGLLDKIADLLLGLILFMILSFETRRYKEWRNTRLPS